MLSSCPRASLAIWATRASTSRRALHSTRQTAITWRRNQSNNTPAPTPPKSKAVEEDDGDEPPPPLPLLQRPLGVAEKPTTHLKTFDERSKEILFDDQKRMDQRRHLIKEATTGYFYDLHMVRYYGGKTWMAPKVLIREDKSLYFPNIVGTRLQDGETAHTTDMFAGKISVVAMLSSKISEHHAQSFVAEVNKRFTSHPAYQYVQVNLQENVLKSFLVTLFLSSLRGAIPLHLHPTYLVSRQNMEYLREPMGMVNGRIGYVYLVDENMRIRWAGCAEAKDEEADGLLMGTSVLLKRHDRAKEAGQQTHQPVDSSQQPIASKAS